MKRLLHTVFYYTRTERIGILYLCGLALVILLLPHLLPLVYPKKTYDFSSFREQVAALHSTQQNASPAQTLFPFDPNTLSQEEWQQLGVSEKLARTILNYRRKGGRFYQKEDLQKIYGLAPETYQRLEPFIQLEGPRKQGDGSAAAQQIARPLFRFDPNKVSREELAQLGVPAKVAQTWINFRDKGGTFTKPEEVQKVYGLEAELYQKLLPYIGISTSSSTDTSLQLAKVIPPSSAIPASFEHAPVVVDINQSDASEWQQLKGIGPAYARRILSFREKLGGFISVDQVAQTYHLPDSTYQAIRPFLRPSPISRPLAINHVSAKELQAHPYLNWKQANAIISYRDQHGNFSQVDDLLKLHALPQEVIDKIAPYLHFE